MKVKYVIANNADELERELNMMDHHWSVVTVYPKADKIVAWLMWIEQ